MKANLSKAQQKLLDEMHEILDTIRKYKNYEDFFMNSNYIDASKISINCKSQLNGKELSKDEEEKNKNWFYRTYNENIVLTLANTKTLEKLEKLGYIEIIEIGYLDKVKVLNY